MNHYALQWLDLLSRVKFDSSRGHTISEEQLNKLLAKITAETDQVKLTILERVFSLEKERAISTLIRQYHSALLSLYEEASLSLSKSNQAHATVFYAALQRALYDLLLFIELRFTSHLNDRQSIPGSYFKAVCEALGVRVEVIRSKLKKQLKDERLFSTLFSVLDSFQSAEDPGARHSIKSFIYKRELLGELEFLLDKTTTTEILEQQIRDVLVFYNFNTADFVTYLTERKDAIVVSLADNSAKINYLKEREDRLLQIGRKGDYKLIDNRNSIDDSLYSWFKRKRDELLGSVRDGASSLAKRTGFGNMFKIACSLSVDQIAILLLAAFDTGVFIARSLSEIFKGLAPFISSKQKKDISWDSMRSKTYAVEERDKDAVIQVLKDMIARIEEI